MTRFVGGDTSRQMDFLWTGRRTAKPAMGTSPLEATVVSATTTHVVVTVNGWDPAGAATFTCDYEPRWSQVGGLSNTQEIPPAGTACLIVIPANRVGGGGWVIAFKGWPPA